MIRWLPAVVILALLGLAALGSHLRAYEMTSNARCNYVLAEQSRPAADVVLIGASRVRRGLDPDYIEALLADAGTAATVERLSLNFPQFSQNYPLVSRYIETRGAPRIAYVQLSYNFRADRQDTWDLPVNPPRNLGFGRWSELVDVQWMAPLNDTGLRLPRQLHADWQSLPAAWLTKVEMNVFSALRYGPRRIDAKMRPCTGDFLRSNGLHSAATILTLAQGEDVEFSPPDPAEQAIWRAEVAEFLPLAPAAPWRRGETAQLVRVIELLEGAGTQVVLMVMPSFEQKSIDTDTRTQIGTLFPDNDLFFPMTFYTGPLAERISVSFADTHHANTFAAVYFSRALASDLVARLNRQ